MGTHAFKVLQLYMGPVQKHSGSTSGTKKLMIILTMWAVTIQYNIFKQLNSKKSNSRY